MLSRIYLSRECCDRLGVLYNTPYQETFRPLVVDPLHLLGMRSWDTSHKSTFHTFIFLEQKLHLVPDWREHRHHDGWFKILNIPNTRFFVTTDVDVELLHRQKDLLEDCVILAKRQEDERLYKGLVSMIDHMLSEVSKSD